MKIKNILSSILLLLVLSFFANSCKDDAGDISAETGHKIGQFAPDFTLENNYGDFVSLADFKGKTVLIEFWASWCSYCNTEAPKLNLLHEEFNEKNFEIIGISIDEDRSAWLNKVTQYGHKYTQLNDPKGFDSPLVSEFDVQSIPKMILVNESGQVLFISTKTDKVREVLQQRLK